MRSKVSGLLHEALSAEAQAAFFRPWIESSLAPSLPFLTQINIAHVVMLYERRILPRETAAKLGAAVRSLAEAGPNAFAVDASLEDVYFNYEAEVIRRLGSDIGGRLHTARSRNDLQSTIDRLRGRTLALSLIEGCLSLRSALLNGAVEHADRVMPGYTHLQHAQPITFGYYLAGIEQSLRRDSERFAAAFERINECPLGSGAMAGTTFPIDRHRVAELLGFSAPVAHALDAVASKDPLIELLGSAVFFATTFGRLAQDFYLMSTFEFSMLDLPDSLAITSSIMPQKKNQAVLEFVKGRQSHLLGALVTSFAAFRAAPFSHALDANADSLHWLWQALDELVAVVPVVEQIIQWAAPKPERMLALAGANFATATDLADHLVQEHSLPFKEAHHITGRIVRLAIDAGRSAGEIGPALVAQASAQVTGRPLVLSQDEISACLDPRAAVARRRNGGGPSEHDMEALLAEAQGRLADDRRSHAARRARLAEAATILDERASALGDPAMT